VGNNIIYTTYLHLCYFKWWNVDIVPLVVAEREHMLENSALNFHTYSSYFSGPQPTPSDIRPPIYYLLSFTTYFTT
jgi:hypothetical protein